MMRDAMAAYDVDVERMPLGMLSPAQVARGAAALVELRGHLSAGTPRDSPEWGRLTSRFYTVIPHAFGRRVPPLLHTAERVQAKFDLLAVLTDIETAQALSATAEAAAAAAVAASRAAAAASTAGAPPRPTVPHPLDLKYASLRAAITHLPPGHPERSVVRRYFYATPGPFHLVDVFGVEREGEAARYAAHDAVGHRRLVWHGSHLAVGAAITASGLRIMPHSGGRVGRGIYTATENSLSAAYVRGATDGYALMYLAEGAFGVTHTITADDLTLRAPPPGADSVVAAGVTAPSPEGDVTVTLDGRKVVVPMGPSTPTGVASAFAQPEWLLYQESQARLRYLVVVR